MSKKTKDPLQSEYLAEISQSLKELVCIFETKLSRGIPNFNAAEAVKEKEAQDDATND